MRSTLCMLTLLGVLLRADLDIALAQDAAPQKNEQLDQLEDDLWDFPLESSDAETADAEAGEQVATPTEPVKRMGEWFGDFEIELRLFAREPLSPEQPGRSNTALAFRPGYALKPTGWATFRGSALVRLDEHDAGRSRVDAREALAQFTFERWTATLGIHKVFWGVAESRHLVDIINQIDYREDLSGDERLGQLMAMSSYATKRFGLFDMFVLSWFRPQTFPAQAARPGLPLPVLNNDVLYESSLGQWNIDLATRWSMSLGNFDWGLSYFYGTAREPQLRPTLSGAQIALQPEYDLIHQGGLDLQWTRNTWLWKFEGIVRQGQGPVFAAVTGGFEKTTPAVYDDADLTLFLEYNYDGRDNQTFTFYENDVFAALRISLNDIGSTVATVGVQADVVSGDVIASVELSRRLREKWKASVEARIFALRDRDDVLYWFRRDDHLEATLRYYF